MKRDVLRAYWILLDGARVGKIRLGGTLSVEIGPGEHWAQARIDICGSRRVDFHAGPGEEVRLVVEPAGNAFMLWQIVLPTGGLRLARVS